MAAVTSTPASPPRKTPRHKIDGSGAEEKLVASLIALMEAGTTPWRREWDAAGGGHHVNLISGRRYRGANPVLLTLGLHLRGSALPYWCGFAEARRLGIFPRKGSKAVHVLRPQVHQRGEASLVEAAAPSSPVDPVELQGEGRRWVSYRPMALFNAADLEGEALAGLLQARREKEGLCRRPEPERLAAAEAVLSAWPVPVRHGGDRACYLPLADCIQLPERCAFHSASGLYATWAHEAIHSTGHASRLARDLTGSLGSPAYAREELVAELGAVLLGDRLEIGSDVRHHAAYLSHWIELLRESPRLLVQVLAQARRAVDLIAAEGVEEPG